jgi:hypothetical protein
MAAALLMMTLCLFLTSCYGIVSVAESESREAEPAQSAQPPAPTPTAPVKPTPSPPPEPTETAPYTGTVPGQGPVCYGHAVEVYADPDGFIGREYGSPFKIVSEAQQAGANTVYYAQGHNGGGKGANYTVLDFGAGEAPRLAGGEVVYASGVIQGKGTVYGDNGKAVDMLWLAVTGCERDAAYAGIVPAARKVTLGGAQYSAASGTLTIEILSLDFTEDAIMLSTKTQDTAVRKFTTYYMDILVHQDGFYASYAGCNYWINPGSAGFDNVPLPPLDSAKDMIVEFIPFGENGALLCEPLAIEVVLAG